MKTLFLVLIVAHVISFSAVTDHQKRIFQMFDSSRDLTLKSDGSIAVEYIQNYSLSVKPDNGQNLIVASPKGVGKSDRNTLYFLSRAGSLKSAFKNVKEKGMTLYTTFESQQIPELKSDDGKKLFKGINLGAYTLICENYKQQGFNPEKDKLCVVANAFNCNNFYNSIERAGFKVDRSALASCNMMFNIMFSNAQIAQAHSPGVPKSLYLSSAAMDIEKLTGQRYAIYPYGPEEKESSGIANVLDYLAYFFEACESYRTTGVGTSASGAGKR